MKNFLFRAFLALGGVAATYAPAHAQYPNPNSTAPDAAPAMALAAPRSAPRRVRVSPDDRRGLLEARLRAMMQTFGVSAPDKQDAVVAYLAEEEAGRLAVREASRRLLNGLRRDAPPERMRDLIDDYKTALARDSKRRTEAQTALDAKVGFSIDTRLEALLWLSGVLGEGHNSLPMSALSAAQERGPRSNEAPKNEAPRRDAKRRGQFEGVLQKKASEWIEVRGETGVERFWPTRNALKAPEPRILALMTQLPLGARVRVEWERSDRRRIVELALAPESNAPTETTKALVDAPQRP